MKSRLLVTSLMKKTWLMLRELNFQQFPFLSHPVYAQINFSFKNTYIHSGFKY